MVDFILHVYKAGSRPFRSLSDLPEAQALSIMETLYRKGSIFWERFADPATYLSKRKDVEAHLRAEFQRKGGHPKESFPVYCMLGRPPWTTEVADAVTLATTEEIEIPLSIFEETDISFTYPDSMLSALIAQQQNPEYYEPELHGKVFTLAEIMRIVGKKGLPGDRWKTRMPDTFAHYIEVQVWNRNVLTEFLGSQNT